VVALCNGSFRCYEEANRIAKLVNDVPVGLLTGAAILLVGVAVFAVCVRSTRSTRLSSIFSVLGKTSYPLYLLHQNMGYLLIRFLETHFRLAIDARVCVMAAMVLLAGLIALYVEPVLASVYRRYLARLAGTGNLLVPRVASTKRSFGDVE
jgi:peptidoglycan/LPS O-acetylase OafA/YrhL